MSSVSLSDYKPVVFKAFVDCGFDHRCCHKGMSYDSKAFPIEIISAPESSSLSRLKSFLFRPWGSERERQLLEIAQKCQQAERRLSQQTYIGFLAPDETLSNFEPQMLTLDPPVLPLEKAGNESMVHGNMTVAQRIYWSVEHDFFKLAGELYLACESKDPRYQESCFPFPSELLRPVHAINSPQMGKFSESGSKNFDLSRLNSLGFYEFSELNESDKEAVERQENFVKELEIPIELLKNACRTFRRTLDQIPSAAFSDLETFKSEFAACKTALSMLSAQWKLYTSSHEMLKRLQHLYSRKDYFESYYQSIFVNRHIYFIEFQTPVRSDDPEMSESSDEEKHLECMTKAMSVKNAIEEERLACAQKLSNDIEEIFPSKDRIGR